MISGKQLIEDLRAAFPGVRMRQVFPFLRVRVVSSEFLGIHSEARDAFLADKLKLPLADLRDNADRLFLRFELLATEDEEGPPLPETGSTWLGTFADEKVQTVSADSPKAIHFYGFKGGQGRTTLLAYLASDLARDGQRVLVVDLDAEAPSLDLVFNRGTIPAEATLVGLRAGMSLTPVPVGSLRGGGVVALVAFRPSDAAYDLDSTALAFEASVHAPSHARLAEELKRAVATDYDMVLFDQRTGLGPTVLSWIQAWPGPVVVFDRLDGQSARATRDVERLWRQLAAPGVVVSYVPPATSLTSFREHHRADVWSWLEALAGAMTRGAQVDIAPEDVEDHWLLWPDDNAFRRRGLPQRDEVGGAVRECVARLREIVGASERRAAEPLPQMLHPSGATDQGLFIATEALRELCQPGSSIRFVFGRKGTGKTRLLAELVRRGIGEPLVVAEDEKSGGLPSGNVDLGSLMQRAIEKDNLDGLWWTLLYLGLKGDSGRPDSLVKLIESTAEFMTGADVRSAAKSSHGARVFLIDGLETMSPNRDKARDIIQALLRVSSSLEQDKGFRSKLSLRVFLRSDVARWGFENFEQQSHGKTVELIWSAQSIFNFVLSRLPHLSWFAERFPDVIDFVSGETAKIEDGAVSEADCIAQLLKIFPEKLGRLNLNTTTFLRTYFSDDPAGEASYYPRVYHIFLDKINNAKPTLENHRVPQESILAAHDEASITFLQQVRQELKYLTSLPDRDMERLLSFLSGRGTPFVVRALQREIRNSLKLKMPDIEAAFEAMKEIGMFEQHPKAPTEWRVGRLFKSALRMKYRRETS
jgi:CobQ/CobB/MinD/ParA nucleotide binding domain